MITVNYQARVFFGQSCVGDEEVPCQNKGAEFFQKVLISDIKGVQSTQNHPPTLQFPSALQGVLASFSTLFYNFTVSILLLTGSCFQKKKLCTLPAQHQMADRQSKQLAGEYTGAAKELDISPSWLRPK